MSFHQDRGGVPPGHHGSPQSYQPTNLRPPQPPAPHYHYDPQASLGYHGNSGFMPPHPDFMRYPPPPPSQMHNAPNQCPVHPPFPKPLTQQGFPDPTPNFPPPPLPSSSAGSTPGAQASAQNSYLPYMMPPVLPPPIPHPPIPPPIASQSLRYHSPYSLNYPHPPFPPPTFNPSFTQNPGSFQPDHSVRHGGSYSYEKPMSTRRSPEKSYHHDDHKQKGHAFSDRHKPEFSGERKERGRSPDRQGRSDGGRYKSEHDRGRTPPRHRSRDRSRERHRHRDRQRSQSPERHRKRPRSRSSSRDRKRGRWEEEKERRSESSSGPSRARSHSSISSRDNEEAFGDRERHRDREKGDEERDEEEFLKPAWIRCTHAENYFSNDPMDQVGDSTVVGTSKLRDLYERFEEELGRRQERAKEARPKWEPPKTKLDEDPDDSSSESDCESDDESSSCSSSSDSDAEVFDVIAEIKRKKAHPDRLHEELWYNDAGQVGMTTATSNWQHSYGLGPRGPNPNPKLGADPANHQAAPPPSGPPRPEEQHHKPFFYVQPPQPYLPMQSMQWPVALPMPVSYNPYYGYPGLGYGLPMMSHYQTNPYLEPPAPGFVVPHTHLHLMDYRRVLNPQYYQTMAYHARRFRYQHNSAAKEMTSSEVQTEPLESSRRTSAQSSHKNSNMSSGPTGTVFSPALAVQKDHSSAIQEKVPPVTATRTPSNSSFMIQTEEVRIECCTTPVGLQLLHAHENADLSHSFSQDVVQCKSVLHSLQDEGVQLPADQSAQELQVCPDIQLVGQLSTSENILPLEEPGNLTNPMSKSSLESQKVHCAKVEETRTDLGIIPKNFNLRDIHLPFDPKYLDELRKMEYTVWSAEETLISSPDMLIQNSFVKSNNNHNSQTASVEANAPEILLLKEDTLIKESVHVIEMIPLAEDELEVPPVETVGREMTSEGDICLAAEDSPMSDLTNSEVVLSPSMVVGNSPLSADGDQQKQETNDEDNQDTSFESLPAYLPSTSCLSNFDHNYYCNKMPSAPKKQNKPLNCHGSNAPKRQRKLDMDFKEPCVRKPKERYIHKVKVDRQSFSDNEYCLSRNFNENLYSPYLSNKGRLCSRCMEKRRICTSPSSECDGQNLKRKAIPFQQWNDSPLPTREACRSHTQQRLRNNCNPNLCSPHQRCDTEGESSGNSSCRTTPRWRAANDPVKITDFKKPLMSKSNTNGPPAVIYPKAMKNCVCNDLQHQSVALERLRHCPHGNTIREIDENCAGPVSLKKNWRNADQMYPIHSWQTAGKSWRDAAPNTDGDCSKSDVTSHVINHKKSQSQGTRTIDTRC